LRKLSSAFGRIDGLVNNAGVNFPRLLVDEKAPAGQYELNEAAFEKMVNINQKGVFLMSQAWRDRWSNSTMA
jgi:D-sorbitol 6-phosphate 2-dehydrogenase (EC 1.1.1.140)